MLIIAVLNIVFNLVLIPLYGPRRGSSDYGDHDGLEHLGGLPRLQIPRGHRGSVFD